MNKMSKESVQLTDKELAGVSGGQSDQKRVEMPPTTIVIFTEGAVIKGTPKK